MIFYGFQDRSFKDRTSHDVQQYRVTLKQKLGIIQSLFGSLGSCNKEKIVAQGTFGKVTMLKRDTGKSKNKINNEIQTR